jgi:hypothetical protein
VVIPDGTTGDVVQFDVTVLRGFTAGSTVIKLNANIGRHFTDVNGGQATLSPAPNNKRYDPATDDKYSIVRPPRQLQPPSASAAQTRAVSLVSSAGSGRESVVPATGVSNLITRFLDSSVLALSTASPVRWNDQFGLTNSNYPGSSAGEHSEANHAQTTYFQQYVDSNAGTGEMDQVLNVLFDGGANEHHAGQPREIG